MVLAQKKYAYQDIPVPAEKQKKGINKKMKLSGALAGKTVVVGLILCAFTLGILFTAQYAKIAAAGFAVNQLKQEIAALETTNQRLYLEILQKQSLERIEHLAITKLGMVYADPAQKQQLAVNRGELTIQPYYVTSNYTNDNVILVEQQGQQLNPIIQAISQVIKLNN